MRDIRPDLGQECVSTVYVENWIKCLCSSQERRRTAYIERVYLGTSLFVVM